MSSMEPSASLQSLIEAWDEGHREFAIAFEGLSDADLWTRAHPRLLSVGELAGHVAYWQAVWTSGVGDDRPDLTTLPIKSPLIDHGFRYYTTSVDQPFRVELGSRQVVSELMRVHEAARDLVMGREKQERVAEAFP